MGTILVVDDERGVLKAFDELLSKLGHSVITASNGASALESVHEHAPDVVVTDLCMPNADGLDLLRQIRKINPRLPVIIMTGRGTMDTAIEATKIGAFDYQLKPFEPQSMIASIEQALESVRLMQSSVVLNPQMAVGCADAIIGDSAVMQEVFKAIGRVAATDATVLIRGESGTGKELVARVLYQHSRRAASPMLVVNCAAIPDALLESELFGHERGAFTGAQARRIGRFEQAHCGTVFLDEIGDIAPTVQAKLLRLLQHSSFERVGGSETIQADVRVLAATNRDLEQAIASGDFREDLFHRLNVVTITIPPLRDRRGDIPKLVDYFVEKYSRELQVDRPVVSEAALEALTTSDWPGNVRELEHCLYRTMIFTRGYPIGPLDITRARQVSQDTINRANNNEQKAMLEMVRRYLDGNAGEGAHDRLISEIERLLINEALHRASGNQTQAAQLLGMARPTLHAKIQRYRIEPSS